MPCILCKSQKHTDDNCNLLFYSPKRYMLYLKEKYACHQGQNRKRYFRQNRGQANILQQIEVNQLLNQHFNQKYPDFCLQNQIHDGTEYYSDQENQSLLELIQEEEDNVTETDEEEQMGGGQSIRFVGSQIKIKENKSFTNINKKKSIINLQQQKKGIGNIAFFKKKPKQQQQITSSEQLEQLESGESIRKKGFVCIEDNNSVQNKTMGFMQQLMFKEVLSQQNQIKRQTQMQMAHLQAQIQSQQLPVTERQSFIQKKMSVFGRNSFLQPLQVANGLGQKSNTDANITKDQFLQSLNEDDRLFIIMDKVNNFEIYFPKYNLDKLLLIYQSKFQKSDPLKEKALNYIEKFNINKRKSQKIKYDPNSSNQKIKLSRSTKTINNRKNSEDTNFDDIDLQSECQQMPSEHKNDTSCLQNQNK